MVGNEIVNVILNHYFDHNLNFKVSKEKYEPIFDTYVSNTFSMTKKNFNLDKVCNLHLWDT
jgi:hypothetical protein